MSSNITINIVYLLLFCRETTLKSSIAIFLFLVIIYYILLYYTTSYEKTQYGFLKRVLFCVV